MKIGLFTQENVDFESLEEEFPCVEVFTSLGDSELPHYELCEPNSFDAIIVAFDNNLKALEFLKTKAFKNHVAVVSSGTSPEVFSPFDSDEEKSRKTSQKQSFLYDFHGLYLRAIESLLGSKPIGNVFLESAIMESKEDVGTLLNQTSSLLNNSQREDSVQLAFNILSKESKPLICRLFVPIVSGVLALHNLTPSDFLAARLKEYSKKSFSLVDQNNHEFPTIAFWHDFGDYFLVASTCDPVTFYTGYLKIFLSTFIQTKKQEQVAVS
ncbi:MAG: hypothetical protein NZT61_05610 [Deltaproteobacteria bacterium]|nr:hypothetical protein [Deltaproteobacteria bacterium]MCX7953353.1 hypothetical protein [Deltaproteobacteria bacterium]